MKIKIKGFKNKIRNFFKGIAVHPFIFFWVMLIIASLVGGCVYYKCVIFVSEEKEGFAERQLNFKRGVYEEILGQWELRGNNFTEAGLEKRLNPFAGSGIISTSTQENNSEEVEEPNEENDYKEEVSPEIQKLLAARNLFTFYYLKGEMLPLASERAIVWEEKGLGSREEYRGLKYQNEILLEALKEELTS
jgi:hypothetical protein